jgi:hypothetical protein
VTDRESTIVHQTARHHVTLEKFKGRDVYKVWRAASSYTHSVLVSTFDLGDRGKARAIADCDRREL